MPAADPDHALRLAALDKAREVARVFDDIAPLEVLREGFEYDDLRVSFGSFMKGIHRARVQRGEAALTLMTTAPKVGRAAPYPDEADPETQVILYHYRAGDIDQPDNRALRAAFSAQVPLIYFLGIDPGQYQVIAPVFVTHDDPSERAVLLEVGLPHRDVVGEGLESSEDVRRYATTQVLRRYHQARFRRDVLRAYRERCAICALRESQLVQASHIIRDVEEEGIAAVVNGIALCAIHHLAYDRNLLGIDPTGVVHIGQRLMNEEDGPMLGRGIQGFHGAAILRPARSADHPDPDRLAVRFAEFEDAAA